VWGGAQCPVLYVSEPKKKGLKILVFNFLKNYFFTNMFWYLIGVLEPLMLCYFEGAALQLSYPNLGNCPQRPEWLGPEAEEQVLRRRSSCFLE
jgi:hypothetical protein